MIAILKREYNRYFNTPVGYIFMVAFLVIAGLVFREISLAGKMAEVGNLFSFLMFVVLFLIPIHTMHLLAEEKKNKTDQLLLTSPVNLSSIVMGKFFASVLVIAMTLLVALVYAVILIVFGKPSIPMLLGNYLGFLLLCASYVSIGLWVSSLTENQVVSAVISYIVLMITWLMGQLSRGIPDQNVAAVVDYLTPLSHYKNFSMGILSFADVIYFLSVMVLFLFLTVRVLEKRRWS